mmetsp:Transcript_45054/g.50211  ORF Transcript_45054/g.50211 Transcript_45054/m.50211 type:complete len:409 (-) Transcript_45054:111-1337(-)
MKGRKIIIACTGFPKLTSIYFAFILVAFISNMLVQKTNSLRVAVLGSGISGSAAARTLADRGVEVTVFEAGFGIGGRTSTRITRDGPRYQFDHGAQYIGQPKTEIFRSCLDGWVKMGFVKRWSARFASVDGVKISIENNDSKERWVGFPRMNSICSNLLHHKNIRVKLQTRADASKNGEVWELRHGKTKEYLGEFDYLIASDRISGAHHRKDLSSANVKEFTDGIRDIKSVKSLTAMVVFEKPLNLNIDGLQFTGKHSRYGSLGWVARDTSKPGRERNDGRECWVLQSHPDAAKELLKGKYKTNEIREMAKDVLVHDFLESIPYLTDGKDNNNSTIDIPPIMASTGHRWGAAFPIPNQDFIDMESQLIASEKFVACGDYFGKLSGRIEGAFLSGRSAAKIIELTEDIR